MNHRLERLKFADIFYTEYLKLMNHYKLLDADYKKLLKKYILESEGKEAEDETAKKQTRPDPIAERNRNVDLFKKKKALEACIASFKDHTDEEKVREVYMQQLDLSIIKAFESLKSIKEEVRIQLFMIQREAERKADPIKFEEDRKREEEERKNAKPQLI